MVLCFVMFVTTTSSSCNKRHRSMRHCPEKNPSWWWCNPCYIWL